MLRFLHLADLHLDAKPSYLGRLARQRNEDFLNAFKRAIDFAIDSKTQVHAIIIAGDLFDSPNPDIDTLMFTIAQFKRLQNEFIPVVLVPGNHDALGAPKSIYSDPGSELRRLVHFIDSPNVECNFKLNLNGEEVFFYGMAWDVHHSAPPFDQFKPQAKRDFTLLSFMEPWTVPVF